jgi:hypothetical protein
MVTVGAVIVLGAAWGLLLAGVEPMPTWFYVFAWYPTLVLFDDRARRKDGAPSLFGSPRRFVAMAGWSVLIWLVFEAANFRLHNWYYVFLPDQTWERWLGIVLSFATVIPAVVTVERWLRAHGVGRRWHTHPITASPTFHYWATGLGLGMAAAALIVPRVFFPLIWGAPLLLADSVLSRHAPAWSLLKDCERGAWGRIGRLFIGGLVIGLLWEGYNGFARGKWIYTVPWLEQTKLFEMPPLGFLGFPFFALGAWSMYHVIVRAGMAPAADGSRPYRASTPVIVAAMVASIFAATAVALGMERYTISSTTPRLEQLPGTSPGIVHGLRAAGYSSVFALADAEVNTVIRRTGMEAIDLRTLVEAARLATLRGIGTAHTAALADIGIASVCGLARADPGQLWTAVVATRREQEHPARPTPAEVRVWVGAARRACSDPPRAVDRRPSDS